VDATVFLPSRTSQDGNRQITRNSPSHQSNNGASLVSYNEERRTTLPLPGFLAESDVRMAIHRAITALQTPGPFHDAPSPHFYPPLAQHPRFQRERERGAHVSSDFHPSLGTSGHPASTYVPFSPNHLFSREFASEISGVLAKFEPGNESESVLKLTKRPKLRPKDLSPRRSLGGLSLFTRTAMLGLTFLFRVDLRPNFSLLGIPLDMHRCRCPRSVSWVSPITS
jgi:hypothetical protein